MTPWIPAIALAALLGLSGCAGTPASVTSTRPHGEVVAAAPGVSSVGLVLPNPALLDASGQTDEAWEAVYGRNDRELGSSHDLQPPFVSVIETRERQRLWISNGRPGENSSFRTRTLRVAPAR